MIPDDLSELTEPGWASLVVGGLGENQGRWYTVIAALLRGNPIGDRSQVGTVVAMVTVVTMSAFMPRLAVDLSTGPAQYWLPPCR